MYYYIIFKHLIILAQPEHIFITIKFKLTILTTVINVRGLQDGIKCQIKLNSVFIRYVCISILSVIFKLVFTMC